MKKTFPLLLFVLISGLLCAQNPEPPKYALVIGNSDYSGSGLGSLANPVNDADDVAEVLIKLGFFVDKVVNGTLEQMENSLFLLKNRLNTSKESYGFFYYAGHGIQYNGENYLIPVDAKIIDDTQFKYKAFPVQAALDVLNDARNFLNIAVLDACRDNPYQWNRSSSNRGLAVITGLPAGSIVFYATSAGQQAQDGEGRNGLFTGQLLNHLTDPDLEVMEVFTRTGRDVLKVSGNRQVPVISSQFFETAYLGKAPAANAVAEIAEQPVLEPSIAPSAVSDAPDMAAMQPVVFESSVSQPGNSRNEAPGIAVEQPDAEPPPQTWAYFREKSDTPIPEWTSSLETAFSHCSEWGPRMWTIGASFSAAFLGYKDRAKNSKMFNTANPWFIGTVFGTLSPAKWQFLEIGLDMGGAGAVKNAGYYICPYLNYALFYSGVIKSGQYYWWGKGGIYLGTGIGILCTNYDSPAAAFIWNVINVGINFLDTIDISYTLRMNPTGIGNDKLSHKLSAGFTYRFKTPAQKEAYREIKEIILPASQIYYLANSNE